MRRVAHSLVWLPVVSSLACASTQGPTTVVAPKEGAPATSPARPEPKPVVTVDGRIGRFESIPWSFRTASYWIEGDDGLVLIDTQFLPSEAIAFVDEAERRTGKKAKLAVVLHANPDKFNGTAALQARGIRVITSEQVLAHIPGIHAKRTKAFYERYQPDYPKELPEPEAFGSETTELTVAGVKLKLHVLGAGCSEDHVVVEHEGHLFVGDLVANENHSWLEIGRTDAWLKRIAEIKALSPAHVHPGRGGSGGPELLDAEQAYLEKVIEIVAGERPALPLDKEALARARGKIEAAFPGYGFPVFLRIGLPAEWTRQARANGAPLNDAPVTE